MFQGTGSDVGKSLIVTGLARALVARGLKVAPFKPQNMSNNAAVTADVGEIGRAQALQARAARIAASVHMNPVLLKPQSDVGAQIVVQGRVHGRANAAEFQRLKPELMPFVLESFAKVGEDADIVLVEGAGSASEVNLRANDIANMGFARAAGIPVVMIGDIDRGGVIASLIGTKAVIAAEDAALIRGFLVNKFRGDKALFADGMAKVAEATGWAPLGLIPFFAEARNLPAEDGLALHEAGLAKPNASIKVAVPILPHIANFDDLDPLEAEPSVDVVRVWPGKPIPGDIDLIVLPGSKSTVGDLKALREAGFDTDIAAHLRRGGMVLGMCGGYQMLGRVLHDPHGVEGPPGTTQGLGLLDVETTFLPEKRLANVAGRSVDGASYTGFEIHKGVTDGPDRARPFGHFADGTPEGAQSADGRVIGTYLHGLFVDDDQRAAWLKRFGGKTEIAYDAAIEETLDKLAAHLERHVDINRLLTMPR
jgi:adenosylcobyric acid synthase